MNTAITNNRSSDIANTNPAIRRVFSHEPDPASDPQDLIEKITAFLQTNSDLVKGFNPPKLIEQEEGRKISISISCLGSTDVIKNSMQYHLGLGDYGLIDHFRQFPDCRIEKKPELPPCLPDNPVLDDLLLSIFSDKTIRYLIVPEFHDEGATEIFLTRYKEKLAENGYEILAKEFYCTIQQPHLDAYHFGMTEKVPEAMTGFLMNLMGMHPRERLVEEFQKAGIRTIALEDRNVINIQGKNPLRIDAFDDSAWYAIQKEVIHRQMKGKTISRNPKGEGKVIIHLGAAHADGVALRLGRHACAIVGARNVPASEDPSFERNGKIHNLSCDLLLKIPAGSSL